MFVDEVTVEVRAGRGGDGVTSFHREKYRPKGGPDGGDGGKGGDVVLVADPGVGTLVEYHFHPHQRAGRGAHGQGSNRTGAQGQDRELRVPPGTIVRDADGQALADLATAGARFVAARGGRGGRGNAALSGPGRRVAHFHEKGEPGQERRLTLELRLLADAALVGFPNAGKSSIVARASAAKPKIADYPFTTLTPVLGVVRAGEHDFVLADVPGLIPGAAAGKGLGHRFLRHVTRSAVLVHVIDLAAPDADPQRSPAGDLEALLTELDAYDPDLAARPALVVANKTDVLGGLPSAAARARLAEAEAAADRHGLPCYLLSAATGEGLQAVLYAIGEAVAAARAAAPAQPDHAVVVAEPEAPIEVVRDITGAFRVTGDRPERWLAMTDLDNPDAVAYLQRRLRRAGVEDLLAEAGARPGDEVLLGDAAFEFQPVETDAPGHTRSRPRRSPRS